MTKRVTYSKINEMAEGVSEHKCINATFWAFKAQPLTRQFIKLDPTWLTVVFVRFDLI
jgi:hypothetical protein